MKCRQCRVDRHRICKANTGQGKCECFDDNHGEPFSFVVRPRWWNRYP